MENHEDSELPETDNQTIHPYTNTIKGPDTTKTIRFASESATTRLPRITTMSFKGFKSFRDSATNDDTSTVVADEQAGANGPASVMYIPENGDFLDDSSTLFNGVGAGKSSRPAPNRQQHLNASLQQLHYNENRVALDRAINLTVELIHELCGENQQRPIFYPADAEDSSQLLLNSTRAHLALVRNNSTISAKTLSKAKIDAKEEDIPTFRLLKLNVKLSANHNDNLVLTLDKSLIAALLEQKLNQQIKYLLNLKERVDDTSSKVFVTGDLNAGKLTFCNALLRRKVLPEDQQPCTSVFCEVIDAVNENRGVEEVHAVPIGAQYDIKDASTYEVHPLKELEDLVYDCDKYSLLKVYVIDNRSLQESLLRNGIVDIKLIDAPGLNMDLFQTTQVFSRQEEIDLIVFVVNAENHFTLSAKEFIAAAAAEKRYVFIVVNKFDNIKDKNKCMNKVLEQVKNLSPDTYKDAQEFVHFVSSSDFDGDEDPNPDDGPDNNGPNGHPDFDKLEASLRKFVLEKRALSKLLPAKNYLNNLLDDLQTLAKVNEKMYAVEKEDKTAELENQVAPSYNKIKSKSNKAGDTLHKLIEDTCTEVYESTKKQILNTVNNFGDEQIVPYHGLQYVYEYAKETQQAMVDTILSALTSCEEQAKIKTEKQVEEIVKVGQATLGEGFLQGKVFKSELMFTRRRDTIKRKINDQIEVSDFFDPSIDSFMLWMGIPRHFTSQFQAYNPVNILSSVPSSAASLKNLIPSQLTLHTVYSSTKLLTAGALVRKMYSLTSVLNSTTLKKIAGPVLIGVAGFSIYYLINDIPNAFPRKQARKIKKQIQELDYSHVNADRISKECRQVLNYPTRQVLNGFQTSIDKRLLEKEKLEKQIKDADLSYGYFHEMLVKILNQKSLLALIELEVNIVD